MFKKRKRMKKFKRYEWVELEKRFLKLRKMDGKKRVGKVKCYNK